MKMKMPIVSSGNRFLVVVAIGLLLAAVSSAQDGPSTPDPPPDPTSDPAPTPAPIDIYKPAVEFLRYGINIFWQRLYDTNLTTPIHDAVFKDDKSAQAICLGLPEVPSFIQDCEKFLYKQNETKIGTTYNETQFNNLLQADKSFYSSIDYIDTLDITSHYGRVYAESIFYVNDISVNVIANEKLAKEYLDDGFIESVNKLYDETANYTADNFIVQYGTHYFSKATFGGSLRIVDLIVEEDYEDTGEKLAQDYLNAFLMQFFGFNGHIHVPVGWKMAKIMQVFVHGGNETMGKIEWPSQAIDWYNSVGSVPILAITKGSIVPLYELFRLVITDPKILNEVVDQVKDQIEFEQAGFHLLALIDAMDIAARDVVVGKLHGCFDSKLLREYFESVFNMPDPRETMQSAVFKERESCALDNAKHVVLMRAFLPKPNPPERLEPHEFRKNLRKKSGRGRFNRL